MCALWDCVCMTIEMVSKVTKNVFNSYVQSIFLDNVKFRYSVQPYCNWKLGSKIQGNVWDYVIL